MAAVEALAESPGERDVPVGVVFPHDAMSSLCEAMRGAGFDANDVDATAAYYRDRIAPRLIVSGFLRDETLGAKRLCSMPDRVTNTIALANGDRACRPSVVNGYEPPLPDLATWWNAWRAFMFDVTLPLLDAKTGETRATTPCHLLRKITRAKYPATTAVAPAAADVPRGFRRRARARRESTRASGHVARRQDRARSSAA
jgi:hypothetical protein